MKIKKLFYVIPALIVTLILTLAGGAFADDGESLNAESLSFAVNTASVELSGPLGSETAAYTVTAGLTPIMDNEGIMRAQIFSTTYAIEPDDGEMRPVAFIFNGGPGSSSIYLHMGGLAPKTVPPIPNAGLDEPAHPYRVMDNPYSPLSVSDLVFVDPVGTGFSRSVGDNENGDENSPSSPHDPETNAPFWGAGRDLASLAEFIRVWLTENGRWSSQVFIIGESYGGLRAARLPFSLSELGIATSGTAMVSPVIDYKYVLRNHDIEGDVNILPTAAAIAHYHGLLADDLQNMSEHELTDMVWKWARTEYRQARGEGNRLSEESFRAVAKELSRLTSLPVVEFIAQGLRFPADYENLILRDNRLIVSVYDGRMTAPSAYDTHAGEDPNNRVANEYYYTALMDFLQGTVGIKTLRTYQGLNKSVIYYWDFLDETWMGTLESAGRLAAQMRRFPSLKVFLAMGRYDLACPPESALAALNDMDVPKERLANIETHMYDGGHMMYTNPEAARKLCEDLSAWITAATR